jgi:seryl-tRNA synthetase
MIDLKALRADPDIYRASAKARGMDASSIETALMLDVRRLALSGQVDDLRATLNVKGKPTDSQLAELKTTKAKLAPLEAELNTVEVELEEAASRIPNLMAEGTPDGGEEANREERIWGEHPNRDFELKDHMTIAEVNDWLDFERGAKVAGSKFYYVKGSLVRLQFAVIQMILQRMHAAGFTPMLVPNMVNSRIAAGTGFLPRGEERQIYKIEGEDLNLIATSEMPMTGYYADEILEASQIPTAFIGYSPAYRMEAGAYGKYSKGLYRVHQFDKLEMYVFCLPEDSDEWHDKLVAIEEDICQALELPYRVVRIAAGDLGAPAYKKFDIEYWSPVEETYRELMSCSNVTDYQTRRLNIRYRDANSKTQFLHTLNGTAAAFSRLAIAIMENHQQADGTVSVPVALQNYYGGERL